MHHAGQGGRQAGCRLACWKSGRASQGTREIWAGIQAPAYLLLMRPLPLPWRTAACLSALRTLSSSYSLGARRGSSSTRPPPLLPACLPLPPQGHRQQVRQAGPAQGRLLLPAALRGDDAA